MIKVLITGTAGFIGFHTAKKFLKEGYQVVGLDNINNYYDINLKYSRLEEMGIPINQSPITNDQSLMSNLHPATIKVMQEESPLEYGKLYQSSKIKNYSFIRLALEDYASLQSS